MWANLNVVGPAPESLIAGMKIDHRAHLDVTMTFDLPVRPVSAIAALVSVRHVNFDKR